MSENIRVSCPNELLFLRPQEVKELCRVGKHSDGGYALCKEAVMNSNHFISLGLGEDWSFERAISEMNPTATIDIYDHTISMAFFVIKAIKGSVKFFIGQDSKSNYFARLKRLVDYCKFWQISSKHHHHKVRISRQSFEKIISDLPEGKLVGLKVDIEGSEWGILETISKEQSRFEFALIEIHDFDGHEDNLREFINDLSESFILAHVHANNFEALGSNGFPSVFEISLLRSTSITPTGTLRSQLPVIGLDAPNAKNRPDFVIHFN
jgi:hypothetical protein